MIIFVKVQKQTVMEQDCPSNNTRSKKKISPTKQKSVHRKKRYNENNDDVDQYGNVKGLIDYDCEEPVDGGEAFIRGKGKRKKVKWASKEEEEENGDHAQNLKRMAGKLLLGALLAKSGKPSEVDDDESDFDTEDDEVDEYTEEEEKYLQGLCSAKRNEIEQQEKSLLEYSKKEEPYRFKILRANIPVATKSMIIQKLDQLYQMEPADNEYHKLNRWIEAIMKVPFDKYSEPIVTIDDGLDKMSKFIHNTRKCLDEAVFGHEEAKATILQSVAQMITNPESRGNVIALQGPMGNGKTTLIKKGVARAMGRPFAFVALGGATDSCFLDGHDFTYEGSQCGKIINILQECNKMDPIIYFDELDKISDTPKGEEIANLLCHLTDHSQNNEFHDKYFSGVHFDLSKATFVFSFNDRSRVNPILMDRMHVIETKGFSDKDKVQIAERYLIPEVCENIGFSNKDIVFSEDILKHLISQYTEEQGVRGLKRCIHEIISKINLLKIIDSEASQHSEKQDKADKDVIEKPDKEATEKPDKEATEKSSSKPTPVVKFNLKKMTFPLKVDEGVVSSLLKKRDIPVSHRMMYT